MSQQEIARAKYIQEKLPLSGDMLTALATYLRETGWKQHGQSFTISRNGQLLKVGLPTTPSAPTVIDAAEAFADILLLLAIQQDKPLDSVIEEIKAVFERENGAQSFQDDTHTFLANEAGLILYETPLDPEEPPSLDSMLYLSPLGALQLADFIQAHRAYFEQRQARLDQQLRTVAQEVLEEIGTSAKPLSHIKYEAHHALIRLTTTKSDSRAEAWRKSSFTDTFSHEQQAELIARYVKRLYEERFTPTPSGQQV